MPAHRIRRVVVCFLFLFTFLAHPAPAGPELSIDTTEVIVDVLIGTVSSNTLPVFNTGDSTLNWTLTDRFSGKVVKSFANPWTSARNMRYGLVVCLRFRDRRRQLLRHRQRRHERHTPAQPDHRCDRPDLRRGRVFLLLLQPLLLRRQRPVVRRLLHAEERDPEIRSGIGADPPHHRDAGVVRELLHLRPVVHR